MEARQRSKGRKRGRSKGGKEEKERRTDKIMHEEKGDTVHVTSDK